MQQVWERVSQQRSKCGGQGEPVSELRHRKS